MKKVLLVIAMVSMTGCEGCGYGQNDNELMGQVKKVIHVTPLICPNYDVVDISLGVLRNGVGSMSTQDVWMTVPRSADYDTLQKAAVNGFLVRVHYDQFRASFCRQEDIVRSVELVPNG